MKKLLIISMMLLSSLSYASCYEFELIGEGVIEGEDIKFIIAKNTQSEVKLTIPIKDQDHFSPYINRWGKAQLTLNGPGLTFESKVQAVKSVQYQTPDPLHMSSSHVRRLRKVPCP